MLTEEQIHIISDCGALGYNAERISILVGFDVAELLKDTSSQVFKVYNAGRVRSEYIEDTKLLQLAQSGDLNALQKIEEKRNNKW